jgi:1-acyl-sn-glycerol-3-phosphate acyltransferase
VYWFLRFVGLGPWLRVIWRPWAEGLEHVTNLPADTGVILASNHLSFCDSFFLPLMVRRRVTFLAKSEYFTAPGVKGWLSKKFFSAIGQVPIDRDDASASIGALAAGVRILNGGGVLGIYPEGTRSPDGRLYKGKTGVARMALEARVVVVPVAMIDTEKTQPTGRKLPHLRPRPGVRFGKPLDFARYEGMAGDRFVERSMTDEIMYELMQLSGQEYVDVYASKMKQRLKAANGAPILGAGGTGGRRRSAKKGIRPADAVGATTADRLPIERAG